MSRMESRMSFIPPVQSVLVQTNFLERKFQDALHAVIGFEQLAEKDPIEARIGEGKTLTKPALLPINQTDSVPSAPIFTDLNNGMTPQQRTFEQYVTYIAKRKDMLTLDLELDWATIASQFVKNWVDLAEQAVISRDSRAAATLFAAYDGGNSYCTGAPTTTGANVAVPTDNAVGFDTAYTGAIAAGLSPGVPQPVSGSNPQAVTIISQQNGTMGNVTSALVTNVAFDATNVSTAYYTGAPYGRSGTLTIAPATGNVAVTIGVGDIIKAVDGSVILRPNGKLSRGSLAATDVATLSLLTKAKGRLVSRGVKKMPNGMYACMIDPMLWSDLENDVAFQRATAGGFSSNGFFKNGKVSSALGLEFVETSLNPVYAIPGQTQYGLAARHALVVGMGALISSPSIGFERAANLSAQGVPSGATDVRMMDGIKMTTRQPLDPEATIVSQTWSWANGHVAATDITSTTAQNPQTDAARYKRGILVEFASQF
jgi:hypothetical protein